MEALSEIMRNKGTGIYKCAVCGVLTYVVNGVCSWCFKNYKT